MLKKKILSLVLTLSILSGLTVAVTPAGAASLDLNVVSNVSLDFGDGTWDENKINENITLTTPVESWEYDTQTTDDQGNAIKETITAETSVEVIDAGDFQKYNADGLKNGDKVADKALHWNIGKIPANTNAYSTLKVNFGQTEGKNNAIKLSGNIVTIELVAKLPNARLRGFPTLVGENESGKVTQIFGLYRGYPSVSTDSKNHNIYNFIAGEHWFAEEANRTTDNGGSYMRYKGNSLYPFAGDGVESGTWNGNATEKNTALLKNTVAKSSYHNYKWTIDTDNNRFWVEYVKNGNSIWVKGYDSSKLSNNGIYYQDICFGTSGMPIAWNTDCVKYKADGTVEKAGTNDALAKIPDTLTELVFNVGNANNSTNNFQADTYIESINVTATPKTKDTSYDTVEYKADFNDGTYGDFLSIAPDTNKRGTAEGVANSFKLVDNTEVSGEKYLEWTVESPVVTGNHGEGLLFELPKKMVADTGKIIMSFSMKSGGNKMLFRGPQMESEQIHTNFTATQSLGMTGSGVDYAVMDSGGSLLTDEQVKQKWYDIKLVFDYTNKTTSVYYKLSSDTNWTVKKENHTIGVKSDFSVYDYLEFVLGSNASHSANNNGTSVYYLDNISIKQIVLSETVNYSVKSNDSYDLSTLTCVNKNGGTSNVVEEDGTIKWSVTRAQRDEQMELNADINPIKVTDKPITIEFTAKLHDHHYRLVGFPKLKDNAGIEYNFGFDIATPNNSNCSLQHMLFRHLGNRKISRTDAELSDEAITDATYVSNTSVYRNKMLKVGRAASAEDATVFEPIGASDAFYDYKFVIDPVAKEYRYYQRAEGAAEYEEIFDGCVGYPIKIDNLPTDISSLSFQVRNGVADSTETGNYYFKDIKVYTENEITSGITGKIVNRVYSHSEETAPTGNVAVTSTVADITANIVNYEASSKTATILLAIYDENGNLKNIIPSETTAINSGINTVTFEDVPAPQALWNTGVIANNPTKTYVSKDNYTYKLFVWSSLSEMTPIVQEANEL